MSGTVVDRGTELAGLTLPAAGPARPGERITGLDTLRGFAVLGILIMNVYAFAMPFVAYANPLVYGGTDTLNLGIWFVTHLFADQKFITIFSMLFGAGIVLLTERAERRGARPLLTFCKRQLGLLAIALIHGYLLWFGDILFFYAIVGIAVSPLRRLMPRTLLIIGALLLLISPLLSVAMGQYMAELRDEASELTALAGAGTELDAEQQARVEEWEASRQFLAPTPAELAQDVALHQRGSYLAILAHRAPLLTTMYGFGLITYGWRIAALMMLGMALLKLGVFSAERSPGSYAWLMGIGYGVGVPLAAVSAFQLAAHQFDPFFVFKRGGHFNYVASLLVALGHVGLVMWVTRSGWLASLRVRLAAVGRMALTHYLTHTVVMTSIFYSYGLGLFARVPRSQQMLLVAALLAFQLVISPIWFRYFRFGPVEWLWRSLTYGEFQRFRAATA